MTSINKLLLAGFIFVLLLLAYAASRDIIPRETYDTLMIFVNFSILIFLFFKFAKNPLLTFLSSKKEELAEDIQKLEDEKREAEDKNKETLAMIEKGEAHIDRIKEKIVEQGKKEKDKIIREAKEQSRYMLEDAKQRVGSQIVQAKREFRSELVDAAIKVAMEKLPKEITTEDNQILLENYLSGTKGI